jgi:hypothetical protein
MPGVSSKGKIMAILINRLLLVFFATLLCSCATVQLANQGNIKSPIEMPSYRINLVDEEWQSWGATRKTENETLLLQKLKVWPLNGEVQGSVVIMVMKNTVRSQDLNYSENEIADMVRYTEEKIMREKGPSEGTYGDLKDVIKDDITYKNKKLYLMTWSTTKGSAIGASFKRTFFGKGTLYLYFPETFVNNHIFYEFIITESYIPGSPIPFNLEQAYRVIDGFEIK